MGTVTIAATYGAGGSVVAPAVAHRLGLPLIDRAIRVVRVLKRAVDLSGLYLGVPVPQEVLGADDRVATTEEVLREATDHGGAVVLGRAAVFVLCGRPDSLHVRLDGPAEARCRQAMRHQGIDEATAVAQQRETDRARAAYVSQFYPGERWDDPANYHLVIDATAVSQEVCVDLIVAAAADRFSRVPAPAGPA